MGTTTNVKRNDVERTFSETITLTGLDAEPATPDVLFLMKQGATLVSKTATVGTIVYADGTATIPVSYTTASGDLNVATGGWRQEWELSWSGGATITHPAKGYNWVIVEEDLNPA